LKSKRGSVILSISVVLLFLALFFWYERERFVAVLVQNLIERVERLARVDISVEEMTLRFPFSLELKGVRVRGEAFSLSAPQGRVSWNWLTILRTGRLPDKVFLELDGGELVTGFGNPLDWLPSFTFSQWPPFGVVWRKFTWQGRFPIEPLEVRLENDRRVLRLGVKGQTWEAQGFLREKESLSWEVDLPDKNPWTGHMDLKTGLLHMEGTREDTRMVLDGRLSWRDDLVTLSDLKVQVGELVFAGEASLALQERFPLLLRGVVRGAKEKPGFSLSIQGERTTSLWDWVGEAQIRSLDEAMKAQGKFSLQGKEKAFSLVLDSVSFSGMAGEGTVRGVWSEQGVNLLLSRFRVGLSKERFFAQGSGVLDGRLRWDAGGLRGKVIFSGDTLVFDRLTIADPRMEVEIMPGKLLLSGSGHLFGGSVEVGGSFQNGKLLLEGKVREMAFEKFSSFPVTGSLSGTLHIEFQEGKGVVQLSLTEGGLWWKNLPLGDIASGSIVYQDGKILGKDIVVRKHHGYLRGDLEIADEDFTGELEATDYPFSYRFGDREIVSTVQGKGFITGTGKHWSLGVSLSSSWIMGAQSGVFVLKGTLWDRALMVEEFSCDWKEGRMQLAGEVAMYEKVNLRGEISRLHLPPNQFGWSGELNALRFTLSGPWREAELLLQAEGGKFAIQGRPLGEKLSLQMEGTLPLPPGPEEQIPLFQYFDPRYFRRGEIRLQGVNLASLGIDFLQRYHGEGVMDLTFHLEPEARVWNFSSENMVLSFPGYVDFRGKMAGTYNGEELEVTQLALTDREKKITLQGWGKVGVREKELDFQLEGEMDTIFPWKERGWLFHGKGKGSLTITGTADTPSLRGRMVLHQGAVLRGDKTYASFSEVNMEVTGRSLRILSGTGQVGEMAVAMEGELSSQNVDLHFRVGGENILPDLARVLRGKWSGELWLHGVWDDLKLQGELSLENGVLDLRETKGFMAQNLMEALKRWEENLPITVELILSTSNILEVKTRFIELCLEGSLRVTGKGEKLLPEGKLTVQKGTYDLVFVKFPLRGYVFFNHLAALEPQLALEGEKEVGKYRIRLSANGGLSDYTIELSSDPPLSKEEILSLLFLGREDAYLALETVNIAPLLLRGLQFLLRENGDIFSRIPFFDGIELDFGNFSRLKLEKRLGKNVSLGYTQELSGEKKSSWNVEVDFSREWSFRGEMDSGGTTEWWLEFRTRF